MDDLISRQAATSIPVLPKEHRKAFNNYDDAFETGWNEALSCVNALPSAQQWIPCSERMPERNGYYLVTGRQGAVNKRLYQDGYWCGNWAIIAWMPLPAPYREEDANATSLEHVLGFVSVLVENGWHCSIEKIEIEDEEE